MNTLEAESLVSERGDYTNGVDSLITKPSSHHDDESEIVSGQKLHRSNHLNTIALLTVIV